MFTCTRYATPRLPSLSPIADLLTLAGWLLHDIAITNIVWCMAYTKGVGGGAYIAH